MRTAVQLYLGTYGYYYSCSKYTCTVVRPYEYGTIVQLYYPCARAAAADRASAAACDELYIFKYIIISSTRATVSRAPPMPS